MDFNDDQSPVDEIPIPVESIALLIRYVDLPDHPAADTSKEADRARTAFDEVNVWLVRMQVEGGHAIPEDDETWVRNHPNLAAVGVCPTCLRNDAYLVVGEEYWGLCHEHRHRWRVDPTATTDMFVPYGEHVWDDPDEPIRKYEVVKSVNLAARQKVVRLKAPEKPLVVPAAPQSETPRLRLVHSSAWREGQDCARPSPGEAMLGQRLIRLVGWAYLLLVILPRESLSSAVDRLRDALDDRDGTDTPLELAGG